MQIPKDWRKGQTIFNFLQWLRKKGLSNEGSDRMADPFYINDYEWDLYYEEFLKDINLK